MLRNARQLLASTVSGNLSKLENFKQMGGGIGFTIMMMNLVKGNRGQLKHVEKIRNKKNETHYIPNDKLKFKEVSEEELSIIKEKIRNEKKKEDIKSLIFIASFVVIMSIVIFLLYRVA